MNRDVDESLGIAFDLNGLPVSSRKRLTARLSDVLRDEQGHTDVKIGCNAGDCGACTVLLDGEPVCACLVAVGQVAGRRVDTLRGLMSDEPVTRHLAECFERHGAVQCGICTPGMLVSATALLRQGSQPDSRQVCDALGGVLCRCTGYRKIIDAVVDAGSSPEQVAGIAAGHERGTHVAQRLTRTGEQAGDFGCEADSSQWPGHVGCAIARVDGPIKARGDEPFGDDVAPTGALVLSVIRSPHHHARFQFGDLKDFVATRPGLRCVLTAADVPGRNAFGVIPPFIDQPVFAETVARFHGEAVAAVVGTAVAIDNLNVDDIPVSWEVLPAVLTPAEAQHDDAPQLHATYTNNVMCQGVVRRGDIDHAMMEADIVVSATVDTGFIEHAYIEPEAGYAIRIDDHIEIHGCTQAPYMNRESLAAILALAPEEVRIVPTAVGGGFGSKLDLSWQPFAALAAWHLEQAVRITYTRSESMRSTTKRHPATMHLQIAAQCDGSLSGMRFDADFNTGAYASWGPTVANRVPIHASGPYVWPHYSARARGIYTHCTPAGAFRGFGVPQAAIAQECLFDDLARRLGIDRLALRLRNALADGQATVTGQVFEQGVGIRDCLRSLESRWNTALDTANAFNEHATESGSPYRRGVGVASGWYGCGNTSLPNPSTIKAGISAEGRLMLHQGAVDIGQGSNTVITQIFATSFGVPVAQVQLLGADTDITPDAGKTSASRQTFVSGNAARAAALALRENVLRLTNCSTLESIELRDGLLIANDGRSERRVIELSALPVDEAGYVLSAEGRYDPPTAPLDADGQGQPYAQFGYAAQLVELTVDTTLGTVELNAIMAAHDVGKAINPQLVEGQIQGGVAQGVGLALMEEFIPGRTDNLHDYLIPTIGDIPPIESVIVEVPDTHGPFGAKGLGEHVLIPTAPAILNAINDACGARLLRVPATPERVLTAIDDARSLNNTGEAQDGPISSRC